MPYIEGNEIESHCGRCKKDTTHVVHEIDKGKVKKVRCTICKAKHAYRKPKTASKKKDTAEKETKPKTRKRRKKATPPDPWKKAMENREEEETRPYSFEEVFEPGEIIEHDAFGKGVVLQTISENKMEVVFQDGIKIMIYNRED